MIFADSGYWIALLNKRDSLHRQAVKMSGQLKDKNIVTSQMGLSEVLNRFADHGPHLRLATARFFNQLKIMPRVEIIEQTSAQFASALQLFQSRPDKEWSLTDCASFVIMKQMRITQALTYDAHFSHTGFVALIRAD